MQQTTQDMYSCIWKNKNSRKTIASWQSDGTYWPTWKWCCSQSNLRCWSNWNQTAVQHTLHALVDWSSHETPVGWNLTTVITLLWWHFLLTQVLKLSAHTDYSRQGNPPLFSNTGGVSRSHKSQVTLPCRTKSVAIKNTKWLLESKWTSLTNVQCTQQILIPHETKSTNNQWNIKGNGVQPLATAVSCHRLH